MSDSRLGPLRFTPLLKQAIWGGRRLAAFLGRPADHLEDCSESWDVADLGAIQTRVLGGPHDGRTLAQLLATHRDELLGPGSSALQFPLLVKWLDATDRLSLQVHPTDASAAVHHVGQTGKTEAWVIVHAAPDSRLWVGLQPGVEPNELRLAIERDDIDSCVPSFAAQTGQVIVVPAGTVHAIGAGVLLVEIQQPSDITYRLYDWGRLDTDGQPRPLDLERGLESIDYASGPVQPAQVPSDIDSSGTLVVDRPEFRVVRHHITKPSTLAGTNQCRVLTVIEGAGHLRTDDEMLSLAIGDTVVLPGCLGQVALSSHDQLTLLESHPGA